MIDLTEWRDALEWPSSINKCKIRKLQKLYKKTELQKYDRLGM